jgi:hypothetical protein
MVEQKINWLCIGFFCYSQLGKRGFANLYYKVFLALNIAQPTCEAQDRSVV